MSNFWTELFNTLAVFTLCSAFLLCIMVLLQLLSTGKSNIWRFFVKSLGIIAPSFFKEAAKPKKKRRSIDNYIKKVGPSLRKRYGLREKYTPSQVKTTLRDTGYNSDLDCYALALYCSHDDFETYHRNSGELCDYNSMRSEVFEFFPFFLQDSEIPSETPFEACDVIQISERFYNSENASSDSSWWSNLIGSNGGSQSNCGESNQENSDNSSWGSGMSDFGGDSNSYTDNGSGDSSA